MQVSQQSTTRAYRRHDLDFKRRVVALCSESGVSVAAIAREHGINANQLFTWRKKFGFGLPGKAVLLPVQVQAHDDQAHAMATSLPCNPGGSARAARSATIEIDVAGVCVRIQGAVDEANLCSVLRALRQSA